MVSINPLIYPSSNVAGTVQNLDIQISYGNSIGNRETVDYNLGLVINAEPTESNFNVYVGDDKSTPIWILDKMTLTIKYQIIV